MHLLYDFGTPKPMKSSLLSPWPRFSDSPNSNYLISTLNPSLNLFTQSNPRTAVKPLNVKNLNREKIKDFVK